MNNTGKQQREKGDSARYRAMRRHRQKEYEAVKHACVSLSESPTVALRGYNLTLSDSELNAVANGYCQLAIVATRSHYLCLAILDEKNRTATLVLSNNQFIPIQWPNGEKNPHRPFIRAYVTELRKGTELLPWVPGH